MKQPPLQLEYANAGGSPPDTPMMSYVDVLLANRFMIIVVTVLATLVGVAYYLIKPPVYQSDIAVQVEEELPTGQRTSMLGDVSSIFDIKQQASGEMEILRSRLVVGHAVDYYQLYVHATPDYFPVIGRWLAKRHESFALPTAITDAIPGGWAWGANVSRSTASMCRTT